MWVEWNPNDDTRLLVFQVMMTLSWRWGREKEEKGDENVWVMIISCTLRFIEQWNRIRRKKDKEKEIERRKWVSSSWAWKTEVNYEDDNDSWITTTTLSIWERGRDGKERWEVERERERDTLRKGMNETEEDENDGKRERVKAGRYLLLFLSFSLFHISSLSLVFFL